MFSLNILAKGGCFHFTIVHPDTCYTSGVRDSLDEAYAILPKLMVDYSNKCN